MGAHAGSRMRKKNNCHRKCFSGWHLICLRYPYSSWQITNRASRGSSTIAELPVFRVCDHGVKALAIWRCRWETFGTTFTMTKTTWTHVVSATTRNWGSMTNIISSCSRKTTFYEHSSPRPVTNCQCRTGGVLWAVPSAAVQGRHSKCNISFESGTCIRQSPYLLAPSNVISKLIYLPSPASPFSHPATPTPPTRACLNLCAIQIL